MMWRIVTFAVAAAFAVLGPIGAALAAGDGGTDAQVVLRDEDDDAGLATLERDDDPDDVADDTDDGGGDSNGATSGVNSNDGTNSRYTGVSRNGDRSRGDLTRDRTQDGPGGATRDRSAHDTNDRSRNDTR
jgi:hypothetical protein